MPLVIIFCHNDMLFSNCWTLLLQICGIQCLQICVISDLGRGEFWHELWKYNAGGGLRYHNLGHLVHPCRHKNCTLNRVLT